MTRDTASKQLSRIERLSNYDESSDINDMNYAQLIQLQRQTKDPLISYIIKQAITKDVDQVVEQGSLSEMYINRKKNIVIKSSIDTNPYYIINGLYYGMKYINKMCNIIPNFMRTYGFIKGGKRTRFNNTDSVAWYLPGNDIYPVLEYIPGKSLEHIINDNEISTESLASVILQVVLSLKMLYSRYNVCHRDVHAGNVMVVDIDRQNIQYDDITITTDKLAVIVDYDSLFYATEEAYYMSEIPGLIQDCADLLKYEVEYIGMLLSIDDSKKLIETIISLLPTYMNYDPSVPIKTIENHDELKSNLIPRNSIEYMYITSKKMTNIQREYIHDIGKTIQKSTSISTIMKHVELANLKKMYNKTNKDQDNMLTYFHDIRAIKSYVNEAENIVEIKTDIYKSTFNIGGSVAKRRVTHHD